MSMYLDYNASTPIDARVLEVMDDAYKNYYGNPDSRTHEFGNLARKKVENSRKQVADLLKISPEEVIFTSGATESNNLAILGFQKYGITENRRHIITTSIEHKAIIEPCKVLENNGFTVDYVPPESDGSINPTKLIKLVRPDTLLVSVMHANNETGTIQPVKEIGNYLKGTKTFFHVDASQSCGKLVDELRDMPYDLLTITAHKMCGPLGVGAIILRKKNYRFPPISPIMYGGGQERGIRPGTLPVPLIVGFGKACEIASQEYKKNKVKYLNNKKLLLKLLESSGVKFVINGSQESCMPNTLNISFLGVDSEALMISTKQYCSISNSSACTAHEYSHSYVLKAMGLPDERINSAVRLSWGRNVIKQTDFKNLLDAIALLI
jgi:cysteine desulfurase